MQADFTSRTTVRNPMSTPVPPVGSRIVEVEQKGQSRGEYGEELISRLALRLAERFRRGFRSQTSV